jgi:hypothetical protein
MEEWTLFVVTDTGKKIAHWRDVSRKNCLDMIPTQHHPDVSFVIEKTGNKARTW